MSRLALLIVLLFAHCAHAGQVIKPKPYQPPHTWSARWLPVVQGESKTLRREIWLYYWKSDAIGNDNTADRVTLEYDADLGQFKNVYWTRCRDTKPMEVYLRPDDTECTETEYSWGVLIWRGE